MTRAPACSACVVELGERVVDHRVQRLGREAFAPIGDAEPVAELRRGGIEQRHAAGAHNRQFVGGLIAVARGDQKYRFAAGFVRPR